MNGAIPLPRSRLHSPHCSRHCHEWLATKSPARPRRPSQALSPQCFSLHAGRQVGQAARQAGSSFTSGGFGGFVCHPWPGRILNFVHVMITTGLPPGPATFQRQQSRQWPPRTDRHRLKRLPATEASFLGSRSASSGLQCRPSLTNHALAAHGSAPTASTHARYVQIYLRMHTPTQSDHSTPRPRAQRPPSLHTNNAEQLTAQPMRPALPCLRCHSRTSWLLEV